MGWEERGGGLALLQAAWAGIPKPLKLVLCLGAFLSSPVGCRVGGSRGLISSPTSCDLTAMPHDTADVPLPRYPSRAPKLGDADGWRASKPRDSRKGFWLFLNHQVSLNY